MPKRKKPFSLKIWQKPPKWEDLGLSQRQLCFEKFAEGRTWQGVADQFDIKTETCRRYYQTWKKLPLDFEQTVRETARLNLDPGAKSLFVEGISRILAISPEMVEEILLRPWGLRSLILARFGLKKITPTLDEKEKVTLLKFRREIIRSGRSVDDVLNTLELREKLHDDILKTASQMFDPTTLSGEELSMLKSIRRQSRQEKQRPS